MINIRKDKIESIDTLETFLELESTEKLDFFAGLKSQIGDDEQIVEFWNKLVERRAFQKKVKVIEYVTYSLCGVALAGIATTFVNTVVPIVSMSTGLTSLGINAHIQQKYLKNAKKAQDAIDAMCEKEPKLRDVELLFKFKDFAEMKKAQAEQAKIVDAEQAQKTDTEQSEKVVAEKIEN